MTRNKNDISEGGYIFVSHSHADIKNVRTIRNALEEREFEPICFYLRCLSDDDEVLDLIKREIDAREWFLLVDSENARRSTWVRSEVEYIKSRNKKYVSVSLDEPDNILPTIDKITKGMTVYLNYGHFVEDMEAVKQIADACIARDLKVRYRKPVPIQTFQDWFDDLNSSIQEAVSFGCVVCLLSARSIRSPVWRDELTYAYQNKANIFAIVIKHDGEEIYIPEDIRNYIGNYQYLELTLPITQEQADLAASVIEKIICQRFF